jgi:hypothetical protein
MVISDASDPKMGSENPQGDPSSRRLKIQMSMERLSIETAMSTGQAAMF